MASDRRGTQRQRLVDGLIRAAGRDGYESTNITRIHKEAGVSRPTIYEYYADRESCLAEALEQISDELIETVSAAVAARPAELATEAALGALLEFADHEPAKARLFFDDSMRAGASALDIRDRSIDAAAEIIEKAHEGLADQAVVPRIPIAPLLGGVYRLLAPRLRRGERGQQSTRDGLLAWIQLYSERGTGGSPKPEPQPTRPDSVLAHAPPGIRGGLGPPTRGESSEIKRRRILRAISELAKRDGYDKLTITQISAAAGIHPRLFKKQFPVKEQAYVALHELYYQQVMGVVASASSSGRYWERRIWDMTRDAAHYLDENPDTAWATLVGGYTAGEQTVATIETGAMSFTLYLREGDVRQAADESRGTADEPRPTITHEAIARTVFEIGYRQARKTHQAGAAVGPVTAFSASAPQVAWIALAPFLGATVARKVVEGWVDETPPVGPGPGADG